MHARWIDIPSADGSVFPAYLSLPPAGKGPGIVLIQEIWGVNEHIRAVADQYALDGYVVLAPDVFWRMQPRVDLNYDAAGCGKAFEFYGKLDIGAATSDVVSTVKYLRSLPEMTGKVATIGYCLGGNLSYRAAAHTALDAAVVYYGGGIDQALDQAGNVTAPILFHYAENDEHIPTEAAQKVKAAFAGKPNATFIDYPNTGHGFNCWGRSAVYDQRAAALARSHTLAFLVQHL